MRARAGLLAAFAVVALALSHSDGVRAQQACFGSSCPTPEPSPATGTGSWVRATSPTFSGTVTLSSGATMVLPLTTFASQGGIVYKTSTPWLHDFNYGNNGTVTTDGLNTFLGGAGNLTMGAAGTITAHGSTNTGVGSSSLSALTLGYSNASLGNLSLSSATTGYQNSGLGYGALRLNTTGFNNVAVGYGAADANTVGSDNVAVGFTALAGNTSGSYNVALGGRALRDLNLLSAIGYNVALGYDSGRGITTGVQNTILGARVTGLPAALSDNVIIADGAGVVRARAVPVFSLTDNTIATFAVLTLGNDTGGGGSFDYCVYAQDATTGGLECGRVDFAGIDVTAGAGGEVCPTPTKVGTPLQALSGSTLAVTFAASTGTDLCNIRVTADTDIATPVALNIKWWAVNSGRTLTPQ